MPSLKELLTSSNALTKNGVELVTRAYLFAEKAHAGQTRYSGEPYFNHVYETAKILAELGLGGRTISAGLLHDILEDAHVTEEELEKEFGKEIVFLVQGVTKLGKIRYQGEDRHVESLRKLFVAMSKDLRVLIIKLADRLHNMRTLHHVPEHKRARIAKETLEIHVPLAYRLGIRRLKRELEDLVFKHLHPQEYEEINQMVKNHHGTEGEYLEKFHKSVLKVLAREGVENFSTDKRLKSFFSIYTKIKNREKDIEKIYDIYALRVNVQTISDCYKVLGILHGIWRPLPGRIKDYIAFPKPNGYQSIHTTLFRGDGGVVEIQIRTHEMHENAEYGLASHLTYKDRRLKNIESSRAWFRQFFPHPIDGVPVKTEPHPKIPKWIQDLVDIQSYVTMPTEFIDNLKTDFFEHRMFIFDQKGAVIDLPIGSSIVDYAYAMDPALGNKLNSAKINGKQVSLDTLLKNGDIVTLSTKSTAHPSTKWLDYCRTALAKKHIRQALGSQDLTTKNKI